MSAETFPQYIRIAYFLASRIAEGDFPIGKRLSGRSKLSSEYQVSPETMRRALQILADMKVVEVKGQSGVYVLSTDNARRCAQNLEEQLARREKAAELRHLLEQHEATGRQILEACTDVLESETFSTVAEQRLPNYQVRISEDSDKIGSSLASLQFWQATGATIVAIRRGYNTMISPGPHAELYGGDYVIFVGPPEVADKVKTFLNSKDHGERNSKND